MLILKILPLYILKLLLYNYGKLILFSGSIFFFIVAGTANDITYNKEVLSKHKVSDGYLYLTKEGNNYDTIIFDDKKEITNNKITYDSYNDLNILYWIMFVIFIIIFLFIFFDSFTDFTDFGWNTNKLFRETIWFYSKSVINGDSIDYLLFDRFLYKTKDINRTHMGNVLIGLHTFSDLNSLPKYTNIKIERENKLKKLKIS